MNRLEVINVKYFKILDWWNEKYIEFVHITNDRNR